MASKKARQRISYVLDLPKSSYGDGEGGHRLGVSGLAVDRSRSILYSGGRDGMLCAWDLNLDLSLLSKPSISDSTTPVSSPMPTPTPTQKTKSKMRLQTQAHTHWINDICLVQDDSTIVSASSDLTVKVWRPHSKDTTAHKIGEHADFVKVVSAPPGSPWVASGGLDRKVRLWDLNGQGLTLEFDVSGEEKVEKGSVYALTTACNIVACGGPESIVRLLDPRAGGGMVKKFVGHTDMIRDILLSENGDMVLSASSDNTVKLWSVTAGRCMYSYSMHNASVWALASEMPDLSVFYSADRDGLIVKTDVRRVQQDMDRGLSLAVAKENNGVLRVAPAGCYFWTSTASSSINRWATVDTDDVNLGAPVSSHTTTTTTTTIITTTTTTTTTTTNSHVEGQTRHHRSHSSATAATAATSTTVVLPTRIPASSVLRISNTADFPAVIRPGETTAETETINESLPAEPIHHVAEETIEGQNGLVKYLILNDRRRVLTQDTAGEVLLWDLIQGLPITKYARRDISSILPEINTTEAIAPWCSVDISSGSLSVVLEPFNCFDAEMYVDELDLSDDVIGGLEFRDDQRVNLGKWVLRYLFADLIDEEIRRDEAYRRGLTEGKTGKGNGPIVPIPEGVVDETTFPLTQSVSAVGGAPLGPAMSRMSQISHMTQQDDDVESVVPPAAPVDSTGGSGASDTAKDGSDKESQDKDRDSKDQEKEKDKEKDAKGTGFKKLRMGMSFGNKKNRSMSTSVEKPPAVTEDKEKPAEPEAAEESNAELPQVVDDSFFGAVQKIRLDYAKQLTDFPGTAPEVRVLPALPNETPPITIPPTTKVIIQEETSSGGSANIYAGTIGTLSRDADTIESKGPLWLGEVLLMNILPFKEPVKVSFVLHPLGELPRISPADGNNRLNANRMLRVRKILAYVADKIDPLPDMTPTEAAIAAGEPPAPVDPDAPEPEKSPRQKEIEARPKPEEYLELYCNEQLLPVSMSLATLRAHVWKSGSDVALYYKTNGKRAIPKPKPPPMIPPEEPASAPIVAG